MRFPKESLRIGKYQVLQRLASGGMGEVFLALQEGPASFLRKVVIKRMRSRMGEDPRFVAMFLNEARLAALLSHPNVVHILELGQTEDNAWFIAMEHIDGRSLREVLLARSQQGTPGLPHELAAQLCADVLRGLHHAHEMRDTQGKRLEIIHRDISPENILVSFSGMVKVVDFGIAKAVSEASSITHVSQLKGKVPYLAPEQLRLERVDARTDIYATGCVLYEMLSGRSAFPTRPDVDVMEEVLTARPLPLGTLCPHLPEELGAIAARAMAKAPADRFASAQEMATALEDFLLRTQVRVSPEKVSRFLAELLGPAALAPSVGVARPGRGETASLPSLAPLPLKELPTEPLTVPQAVPLGPTVASPTQGEGAPTAELSEEPVTEEAMLPRHEPEPAAAERPEEAPARTPAWRWLVPFLAAATLGLLLTLGMGFLPSEAPPPGAASPEEPEPAQPEAGPSLPPPASAPLSEATAPPSTTEAQQAGTVRKGRLVLQVKPSAEVFLGSRRLGESSLAPLQLELPAGQHTLTLKNSRLGITRQLTVKVPAGGKLTVRENLARPVPKRQ